MEEILTLFSLFIILTYWKLAIGIVIFGVIGGFVQEKLEKL